MIFLVTLAVLATIFTFNNTIKPRFVFASQESPADANQVLAELEQEDPNRPQHKNPAFKERIEERVKMVARQIQARDVNDPNVLKAMRIVPRHAFVPQSEQSVAYIDSPLPIGYDQTISQPYIVALMTTMLDAQEEHRVLEVGTGSGYQTMILARLAREVYTMERIAELQEDARRVLASLGVENVHFIVGDGTLGYLPAAPYDRILVTAGAPDVPSALVDQLTEGGVMVLPVGPTDRQTLTAVEKRGGRVIETPGIGVRFVKLIGTYGWRADEEAEP